jgi:hypothetical protein
MSQGKQGRKNTSHLIALKICAECNAVPLTGRVRVISNLLQAYALEYSSNQVTALGRRITKSISGGRK